MAARHDYANTSLPHSRGTWRRNQKASQSGAETDRDWLPICIHSTNPKPARALKSASIHNVSAKPEPFKSVFAHNAPAQSD